MSGHAKAWLPFSAGQIRPPLAADGQFLVLEGSWLSLLKIILLMVAANSLKMTAVYSQSIVCSIDVVVKGSP